MPTTRLNTMIGGSTYDTCLVFRFACDERYDNTALEKVLRDRIIDEHPWFPAFSFVNIEEPAINRNLGRYYRWATFVLVGHLRRSERTPNEYADVLAYHLREIEKDLHKARGQQGLLALVEEPITYKGEPVVIPIGDKPVDVMDYHQAEVEHEFAKSIHDRYDELADDEAYIRAATVSLQQEANAAKKLADDQFDMFKQSVDRINELEEELEHQALTYNRIVANNAAYEGRLEEEKRKKLTYKHRCESVQKDYDDLRFQAEEDAKVHAAVIAEIRQYLRVPDGEPTINWLKDNDVNLENVTTLKANLDDMRTQRNRFRRDYTKIRDDSLCYQGAINRQLELLERFRKLFRIPPNHSTKSWLDRFEGACETIEQHCGRPKYEVRTCAGCNVGVKVIRDFAGTVWCEACRPFPF